VLIRPICGCEFVVGMKLVLAVDGGATQEICGGCLAAIVDLVDFAEISCGVPMKTWASRFHILLELNR
jgi:hypothetical protein